MSRRYATALRNHLARRPRASARPAGQLGRQALAAGLGVVDLVEIHHRALLGLLSMSPSSSSSRNGAGLIRRAGAFLVEALAPIDGNGVSTRGNTKARRRTDERVAANRRAKREMARRKNAERALHGSEQHYRLLLEKAMAMQEHLRHLSHRVLSAQEEERRQISRELHDEIGQTLTGITVKLATLRKEAAISTQGLERKIASTQRLLEKSMKIVHRFARELRPPLLDDLGLIPALQVFVKQFTKRTRLPIKFTAFAAVERLDGDKRIVLYRVCQEALTNVAKHAEATRVSVRIRRVEGDVRLEIHDDGKAFQVQRVLGARRITRLGLLGMRERIEMVGGAFSIESAPGRGTVVRARIPMEPDARIRGS